MSTWGRKCDASPGAQFGLPFLLVFDVAADDIGDIGVLFFLFLDEGVVVVERLVHLDLFLLDSRFLLDPRFRGRGLLGGALRPASASSGETVSTSCGSGAGASSGTGGRGATGAATGRTGRVATTTSYTAPHFGQ